MVRDFFAFLTFPSFHATLELQITIYQEASMTLLQRYLTYLSEICEGSRQAPAVITLTKQGDMERAIELV